MGSLVFLAAVVAVILLVHWTAENDVLFKKGEKTKGIFALKEESDSEKGLKDKKENRKI